MFDNSKNRSVPFSLERALDECASLVDDVAANDRIQGLPFQFVARERRVVALTAQP
jgi:hypothetical protein